MKVIINGVENPDTITVKDLVTLSSDQGFKISPAVLATLDKDHNAVLTRDDEKEFVDEDERDNEVHYNGEIGFGDLNVVFYKFEDSDIIQGDLHITSADGGFGFGG